MAPSKFNGSVEELKDRVSGIPGEWSKDDSGKHTFRASSGAILNFWPSRGTVQFQGNKNTIPELESLLADGKVGIIERPQKVDTQANIQEKQKIFIVHGHDTEARDQLELALRRLGLEPFILMNAPGQGKTLIEALEGHIGADFSAAFGIVLMTPDDMGYAKKDGADKIEPRARQNVILETGMLLSSLTRSRMSLIVKGHIELPTDLEGIIRLGYNDHIREIVPKLAQNLKLSGFFISSEAISQATA